MAADYREPITDPLIELLAIKLYEHDTENMGQPPKALRPGWVNLCNDDRESFRRMARGEDWIGVEPTDG